MFPPLTWMTPSASAATAACSGVRPVKSRALTFALASSSRLAASVQAYLMGVVN